MSDTSAVGTQPTTRDLSYSSTALQNLDKETFLKLLVAQMQYQNPLSPVDSTQFLSQAAQYASVEQLENMAQSQAELKALQLINVATGMVGAEVTGTGPTGEITGVVESVRFVGSEPMLVVDGVEVPVTAVSSIRHPDETATDAGPPDATDPVGSDRPGEASGTADTADAPDTTATDGADDATDTSTGVAA